MSCHAHNDKQQNERRDRQLAITTIIYFICRDDSWPNAALWICYTHTHTLNYSYTYTYTYIYIYVYVHIYIESPTSAICVYLYIMREGV